MHIVMFEHLKNMHFSWGTSFPYVQINVFMAAVNVSCRWYPVLPISQPSEIAYIAWLLSGVVFEWSWLKKILILSDNQIINSHMINWLHKLFFPFPLLLPVRYVLEVECVFQGCFPSPVLPALPAALLGELLGPSSAAHPDTHPSHEMRSLSKYVLRSETIICKKRRYFPLPFRKHEDNTDGYRAQEIWYVKCTKAHVVPSPQCGGGLSLTSLDFIPFPGLSGSVLSADHLQKAASHPLSQLLAQTFGISPQDGYSRGSSRTSFSRALSPCVLSPAWSNLSFCPYPCPQQHWDPPSLRGLCAHGVRTEGEGQGLCGWDAPQPLQSTGCVWESKSDAACFYITDLMGFVVLAYMLMFQLSLAVSETSGPPSAFLLFIFFLKKKGIPVFFHQGFHLEGWIKWVLF